MKTIPTIKMSAFGADEQHSILTINIKKLKPRKKLNTFFFLLRLFSG
ncbi:hypothetical protein HMPREF1232_1402 [Streptococcus pyogenes GA40468]|nr:hypothetical protein HMPREF1232_1402 [Streptococcus pyogenes GA40468]